MTTATAAKPRDDAASRGRPRTRTQSGRSRAGKIASYAVLIVVALGAAFPFYAMVILSFKNVGALTFPDALLPLWDTLTLQNYELILARADRVLRWFVNSSLYAGVSVVLVLALSTMAGYAFAKKRFAGREILFWTTLAMLMVPFQVTLVPLFILISKFGWVNTYWGLIIPGLATTQGIFLMRQFIAQLPDELFEAARLDGASEWRMFTQIVIPLVRPALATLGVFVFLWNWNDFLWPLVMAQEDAMRTMTVGLATLQAEQSPIGVLMASAAVSFVPSLIVFLVLQRFYVQGIATSGLK